MILEKWLLYIIIQDDIQNILKEENSIMIYEIENMIDVRMD